METHMRYIARTPNLLKEKAFGIYYPVDIVEGAKQSNITDEERSITARPIENPDEWDLDVHGFCFLHAATYLSSEDAFNRKNEVQDSYWYEIEALLHRKFPQYSRIEAVDMTVRRRGPDYPGSLGFYREDFEPPAGLAHVDYSKDGAYMMLEHVFPGQEAYWKDKKFDQINVWRPLRRSDDWPLAVCDFTTVDINEDILVIDSLRRNLTTEGSLLHHNDAHRWYYFKDQGIDDLLIFRNCDSENKLPRAFHAAVCNPNTKGPPRESVEVRVVAFY